LYCTLKCKLGEKEKMQKIRGIILFVLIFAVAASLVISSNVFGQVYFPEGYEVPTYAYINVAPNPIGVGQTVNVNFFLATPMETSERPINMTVRMVDPDGKETIFGPYTGDTTGGTFFNFVPDKAGDYTFQFIYGGQTLAGDPARPNMLAWKGLVNLPSQSEVKTLTVQEEPITQSHYPTTPLPTEWWQTPVPAQNVEQWYKIMGPWLGFGAITFGQTGSYNATSFCNPYTTSPLTGHIIWTKPWGAGGVVGGDAGGTQDTGHYWTTRQYQPQYEPIIINGILYSQLYPTTMGANQAQGIQAVDLYTGETLWTINTTNRLRCGMTTVYNHVNQYGVLGPFIWTTGQLPASDTGGSRPALQSGTVQWNMYDATTGHYMLSLVNGSALTLRPDEHGNLIGYFINNTAGTETVYPAPGKSEVVTNNGPHMTCVNFTMAIGQTGGSWQPAMNAVRDMSTGYMWSKPIPTNISGAEITPAPLYINAIVGEAVFMTTGFVKAQYYGGEVAGWLTVASMDQTTGQVLWLQNLTYAGGVESLLPFTRTSMVFGEGKFFLMNCVNYKIDAFDVRTGTKVWTNEMKGDHGAAPNDYDLFSLKPYVANGHLLIGGLGGDIWSFDTSTGAQNWYTNTTKLIGEPGLESPYGIWPIWVFDCNAQTADVCYWAIGHEYNPPLFHGAQMLAINMSNGQLIWSELGTYIRSTSIAYGVMLSLNAYDNQIYAFAKGPSSTTVSAPSVGITTATPVTISGTVMDVSAGSQQDEIAKRFPNGLPCVSDESQSHWMEYVYQKQVQPADATGVEVKLSVVDSNGNFRDIGTTTSSAKGYYSFVWTPDIPGEYTLYASFSGSESYYGSSAETSFYAQEAPSATHAPEVLAPVDNTLTIIGVGIALIIAVAIVGIILYRKP
jgi:hypothetical protein